MPRTPATAISYLRFSSGQQQYGDSLRRQLELAEGYAQRNNLTLDSLTYRDLGRSAFTGAHAFRGALSFLLEAVRSGRVAPGTYILLESLDRLTREAVFDGIALIRELLNAGLFIVTLDNERTYTSELDEYAILEIVLTLTRARQESVVKSRRISASWSSRRAVAAATGRPITREIPGWLDVSPDGSHFIVLEDRAASLRRAFDLYNAGYGATSIVRIANGAGWPIPSRASKNGTWHTSLINRLIANRATLGEYQPQSIVRSKKPTGEPVVTYVPAGPLLPHYYPRVLSDEVFNLAQARRATSSPFPGRTDAETRNILKSLVTCSACGARVHYKNKHSAKQPGYALYYCANRLLKKCDAPGIPAPLFQRAVISAASQVMPEMFGDTPHARGLAAELAVLDVQVATLTTKISRTAALLSDDSLPLDDLRASLASANAERTAAQVRRSVLLPELTVIQSEDSGKIAKRLQTESLETEDGRADLRTTLARGIDHIELHAEARFAIIFFKQHAEAVPVPLAEDAAGYLALLSAGQAEYLPKLFDIQHLPSLFPTLDPEDAP